jgi:hypothetical protein
MVRKFLQYCCVVVGLGCASTVQAVPITFDLTGSGGKVNSISYTVDTVTVIATPLTSVGTAQISPEATGLGVRTGTPKDHAREIDRAGAIETLRLTFDQSVELHSVVFGQVGLDDDFALAIDETTFVSSAPIPGGHAKGKGVVTVPFLNFPVLARTGAVFDFTVPDLEDDYRVKGITVSLTGAVTPISHLPEPSALLLLGTGMVGLVGVGMVRGRRQRVLSA